MQKWRRHMPELIEHALQTGAWHSLSGEDSSIQVLRLSGDLYLKITPVNHPESANAEFERMMWLDGKIAVPHVQAYASSEHYQYLITRGIAGVHPFHDSLAWTAQQRIAFVAMAARRLHRVPFMDCPFEISLDDRLAQAAARIAQEPTKRARFADLVQGRSAEAVYDEMLSLRPADEARVLTHGDLYPVNLLADVDTQTLTGYLDVSGLAVADRYVDLATLANAITWHFGAMWVPRLFKLYGIPLNPRKLRFYRLLSAFF